MSLTCNIDSRGRAVRLVCGLVLLVAGVFSLALWALAAATALAWIVSALLLAAGAFAVFEAQHGWCALRALGFKTRL